MGIYYDITFTSCLNLYLSIDNNFIKFYNLS